MLIRQAQIRDLTALTTLYNHYVVNTAITFDLQPLSEAQRAPWLQQYGPIGRHQLWVAQEEPLIVNYAGSNPFRPKQAYQTSVETSVYLAHGWQGRGIGTRLYQALFESLAAEDVHRAYAGITLPNLASITLHRKFGVEPIGIYRDSTVISSRPIASSTRQNQSSMESPTLGRTPDTWEDVLKGGRHIKLLYEHPVGLALLPHLDSEATWRALLYSFGASEQDANNQPALKSLTTRAALEFGKVLFEQTMTDDVLIGGCFRTIGRCWQETYL